MDARRMSFSAAAREFYNDGYLLALRQIADIAKTCATVDEVLMVCAKLQERSAAIMADCVIKDAARKD